MLDSQPLTLYFTHDNDPHAKIEVFLVKDKSDAVDIIKSLRDYKMIEVEGNSLELDEVKAGMVVGIRIVHGEVYRTGGLVVHNELHPYPLPAKTLQRTIGKDPQRYYFHGYSSTVLMVAPQESELELTVKVRGGIEKTYTLGVGSHMLNLRPLAHDDREHMFSIEVRSRARKNNYTISRANENGLSDRSASYTLSKDEPFCLKFRQEKASRFFVSADPDKRLLLKLSKTADW